MLCTVRLVPLSLCAALFLHGPRCICVAYIWACARMLFPAPLSLCLSCSLLCAPVWVKCQSHFAFITWGTERRALLCNLRLPAARRSAPDVPGNALAAAAWRLLNTLFSDYSIKTAKRFVSSDRSCCARCCETAGEGWQMVWLKASRTERLIDWLIVMDWPAGVWIRIMNTFMPRAVIWSTASLVKGLPSVWNLLWGERTALRVARCTVSSLTYEELQRRRKVQRCRRGFKGCSCRFVAFMMRVQLWSNSDPNFELHIC